MVDVAPPTNPVATARSIRGVEARPRATSPSSIQAQANEDGDDFVVNAQQLPAVDAGSFHPVETHVVQPTQTFLVPIKAEDMDPPIIAPIEPLPAPFEYTYPVQAPLDPKSDYLVQMEAQEEAEFEHMLRLFEETALLVARAAAANSHGLRRLMEESAFTDEAARGIALLWMVHPDVFWELYTSGTEKLFTGFMNREPAYSTDWEGDAGEDSGNNQEAQEEEEEEAEEGEQEEEEVAEVAEVDMTEAEDHPRPQNKRTRDEAEEEEDDANERPAKKLRLRDVYLRALAKMRSEIPPMPPKPAPGAPQSPQAQPAATDLNDDAQAPILYGPESQFVYVRPVVVKVHAPQEEAPAPAPEAMEVDPAPELAPAADAPPVRESTPVEVPPPAAPMHAGVYAPVPNAAPAVSSRVPFAPLAETRAYRPYEEASASGEIPGARSDSVVPWSANGEAGVVGQPSRPQYPIRTIDGRPPRFPLDIDIDVTMSDSSGSPSFSEADDEDVQMEDAPGRSWAADVAARKAEKARQEAQQEDVFGPVSQSLPAPQRGTSVGPIRSPRSQRQNKEWPSHPFNGPGPSRRSFAGTPYNFHPPLLSTRPSEIIRYSPPSSPVPLSASSTRKMLLENQSYAYRRTVDQQGTDSEDGALTDGSDMPVFAIPALPQRARALAQPPFASTTGLRPGTPRPTAEVRRNIDGRGVTEPPPRTLETILTSGTDAELRELRETGISRGHDTAMMRIPPAGTDLDFGLPPRQPTPPRDPADPDWLGLFS